MSKRNEKKELNESPNKGELSPLANNIIVMTFAYIVFMILFGFMGVVAHMQGTPERTDISFIGMGLTTSMFVICLFGMIYSDKQKKRRDIEKSQIEM